MRNPSQTIYENHFVHEVLQSYSIIRSSTNSNSEEEKEEEKKGFIHRCCNERMSMYVCTYEYEVQEVKAPIGSERKRNIIFFGSNFLSYTFHF